MVLGLFEAPQRRTVWQEHVELEDRGEELRCLVGYSRHSSRSTSQDEFGQKREQDLDRFMLFKDRPGFQGDTRFSGCKVRV